MLCFVRFEMVSSLKPSAMRIQYWDVLGITCLGLPVYISIYGERWEARSENGATISKGSEVKIVRNESLIMYVVQV